MTNGYALVTGASSGIGFYYARELASMGYRVIIVSNEDEALRRKAEEISRGYGVEVIPIVMDLGTQDAAEMLYLECNSKGLEVDVLINNAGVYHDKDFIDDSPTFTSLILNLHMYTPAMLCYLFGKEMAERGKGYILNMSSITSHMPVQRMSTYGSTKAFLEHFTRSLHVELMQKGVNVTCVRPGAVATSLYKLNPSILRAGLACGFIITPERLAHKGIRALMRGRAQITPGISSKLLSTFVRILPTCLLRLIRRMKIF